MSNIGDSLTGESNSTGFDKNEYQRDYMRKRRERQKVEGDQKARVDLSVTDQAFDAAKPGYFIFREKSEERKCWNCSDTFETKLELNKFCSPKCKEEFLRDSLNANRKEKP